jgi:hypothetical protein
MKSYGGVGIQLHVFFLISALDGGEWSVSRSDRFTPVERASGACCIGGWGWTPEPVWDILEKTVSYLCRKSNPDFCVVQLPYP